MKIKAPGRICLFGEHQDYLGFPVIAAAINRFIFIEDKIISQTLDSSEIKNLNIYYKINMPNISKNIEINFNLNNRLVYTEKRDYLKSGINIIVDMLKNEFSMIKKIQKEFFLPKEITITGNLPINAGASSSSALVIAWIFYLSKLLNLNLSKTEIANLGYLAEVKEFNEAGGMMDHFTSAIGGIIYLETYPKFYPQPIEKYENNFNNSFILINTKKSKDTIDDLKKVKNRSLKGFEIIEKLIENFDKYSFDTSNLEKIKSEVDEEYYNIVLGNLENRDLTQAAKQILNKSQNQELSDNDKRKFGSLIFKHHKVLSEKIQVSTQEIDNIIEFGIDNGAYGGKINGSGFGGTLFLYCPENRDEIFEKLKNKNYEVYKIEISNGVELY